MTLTRPQLIWAGVRVIIVLGFGWMTHVHTEAQIRNMALLQQVVVIELCSSSLQMVDPPSQPLEKTLGLRLTSAAAEARALWEQGARLDSRNPLPNLRASMKRAAAYARTQHLDQAALDLAVLQSKL